MKITKTTKAIGYVVLLTIGIFSSCVKDQDFETPTVNCTEPTITATNTIQQVKNMYTFGGATVINTDVIIEGYVVSDDKSGNIYKTLSIQDKPENPTAAIKIAINKTNLYTKYNVGRKIYVKLKGLAVGYSFGSIQIGKAVGGDLDRIPALEVNDHILRSCEVAEIIPKKVSLSELNEDMLEMLIEIENVQFKESELGNSYANVSNTATVNRVLESFTNNCNLLDEIIVRNSGFSKFKTEILPEGKGSVVAIFSNYYDDFQLYLRSTEDVNLTEERCNYSSTLVANITLLEVREMYTGTMIEFGITNNYIVEGYVVSSDKNGNFEKRIVLQNTPENPTAGIQILVDKDIIFEDYNVGDKLFVKLDKLYMAQNNGILTIGFPDGDEIEEIQEDRVADFVFNSGENFQIIPTEILITDILNPMYKNTLVSVQNVQLVANELGSAFAFFSGTNNGTRTLETCNESKKLMVFTNGNATFANELFPEEKGTITGVLTTHLEVRTITDVQFTNPYETCPIIIPKIIITEVADPAEHSPARFVELYNAGDFEIDLTGWKLNKYINDATTVSGTAVNLSGIIIPVGGFVIIANTRYATIFSDTPTIETSYISGNGDDVYELVDNTGTTQDIYGVIGEDGSGTNWEYVDGKAIRNITITEPNATFTVSEWVVYSAASNSAITNPNTPQNAPDDFNPRER